MFTIFTPTYNRANKLPQLYQSLLCQDDWVFEWLIIDDGSSDNTEELIKSYIEENKIKIRYFKQGNAGKMKAYNRAADLANYPIFICVDSDDYLVANILPLIALSFEKITDDDSVCAVVFHNQDSVTKEMMGLEFPENNMICTYAEMYYKYNVEGDKNIAFKSSVLKEHQHKVQSGEKFVPEGDLFLRLSDKYRMMLVNESIVNVEYLDTGYSNNYLKLALKNPKGHINYYLKLYQYKQTIYVTYLYLFYSLVAKKRLRDIFKLHQNKLGILILLVPTYYQYLRKRGIIDE